MRNNQDRLGTIAGGETPPVQQPSNPEQTLREICDYCKLEFEPQLLNFQNFDRSSK